MCFLGSGVFSVYRDRHTNGRVSVDWALTRHQMNACQTKLLAFANCSGSSGRPPQTTLLFARRRFTETEGTVERYLLRERTRGDPRPLRAGAGSGGGTPPAPMIWFFLSITCWIGMLWMKLLPCVAGFFDHDT